MTEAAKGLQYIASKGCLHRDIAARNCLLTKDEALKIADFGLTLNAKKAQMDNLGKVPIKWLAKEVNQPNLIDTFQFLHIPIFFRLSNSACTACKLMCGPMESWPGKSTRMEPNPTLACQTNKHGRKF